jgi:hypothetical protein
LLWIGIVLMPIRILNAILLSIQLCDPTPSFTHLL